MEFRSLNFLDQVERVSQSSENSQSFLELQNTRSDKNKRVKELDLAIVVGFQLLNNKILRLFATPNDLHLALIRGQLDKTPVERVLAAVFLKSKTLWKGLEDLEALFHLFEKVQTSKFQELKFWLFYFSTSTLQLRC